MFYKNTKNYNRRHKVFNRDKCVYELSGPNFLSLNILYRKDIGNSFHRGRRKGMYCINYVIKQGDSLYSISRQYHVSIDSIINANPLINVYNLQVDEVICIPVSVPQNNYMNYTTYLVEEGDTLGSVLAKYEINLADMMKFNDLTDIRLEPGTTLQVPIVGVGESGVTL